jgi:hypothetical protein
MINRFLLIKFQIKKENFTIKLLEDKIQYQQEIIASLRG